MIELSGNSDLVLIQEDTQGISRRCWSGQIFPHEETIRCHRYSGPQAEAYFNWIVGRVNRHRPFFFNREITVYTGLLFTLKGGDLAVSEALVSTVSTKVCEEEAAHLALTLNEKLREWEQ